MARTIHDIRWESERNRAQLAETVETLRTRISDTADDIRQKVSPEHIRDEVSGYVAGKGRQWFNQIKQQARDNPMQAVAAGMAVAVPALKIARAIPMPLLMIGAGLALSSKRVRDAVSDQLPFDLNEVTDKARAATADAVETAGDIAGSARQRFDAARTAIRETAHDARDAAASTYENARQSISGAASSASASLRGNVADAAGQAKQGTATLRDISQRALGSVEDAASLARNKAADAGDKLIQVVEASRDTISDYAAQTADYATRTAANTAQSAQTLVRDNAVIVGAVGLAVGAIIAAALPSTRAENKAMGSAASGARRLASDAAEETFDKAKGAVLSAVDEVSRKVTEADLGSGLSRVTGDVADKLKAVADKAVTTAFEPDHSEQR